MSRKSKLQHQYIMELKKECKFGQSKNQAKQKAREEAAQTNEKFKQVKGIYSYKSYNNYVKSLNTFTNWVCKNHSEVKNMEQAKRYVPEYIDGLRQRGLSEWTIHAYAYSLVSAYHCEISDLGITLGTRSRADVIRNRDAADSALRNDERYEVNNSIEELRKEAIDIKAAMGKLQSVLKQTVATSQKDINNFLESAGITYQVGINLDENGQAIATLQYVHDKKLVEVDKIRKHLSWGERNAFSLVLFMFYAISENAKLVFLNSWSR